MNASPALVCVVATLSDQLGAVIDDGDDGDVGNADDDDDDADDDDDDDDGDGENLLSSSISGDI